MPFQSHTSHRTYTWHVTLPHCMVLLVSRTCTLQMSVMFLHRFLGFCFVFVWVFRAFSSFNIRISEKYRLYSHIDYIMQACVILLQGWQGSMRFPCSFSVAITCYLPFKEFINYSTARCEKIYSITASVRGIPLG